MKLKSSQLVRASILMSREGHVKSIPDFLLCQSVYHHPGCDNRMEMQSWLGCFEDNTWCSDECRVCILLPYLACCVRRTSLHFPRTQSHLCLSASFSDVKIPYGLLLFFLSKMPWDYRQCGIFTLV